MEINEFSSRESVFTLVGVRKVDNLSVFIFKYRLLLVGEDISWLLKNGINP